MQKHILLIRDRPASYGTLLPALKESFPHHHVALIDAADIHAGALDHPAAKMLVLPGINGEASRYPELIGEDGLKRINVFAANNVVLAICAATYFVCRETRYAPHWGPEKRRQSINHLFDALAKGPVGPYGRQPQNDPQFGDVVVVPVRFKNLQGAWQDAQVCYGNGPALYPLAPDKNAEPLAVFSHLPQTPFALLRKQTEGGALYLSCILPDIGYFPIAQCNGFDEAKRVMKALKPHEAGRMELWQTLISRIGQDMRP